jgi:hypothetical protein
MVWPAARSWFTIQFSAIRNVFHTSIAFDSKLRQPPYNFLGIASGRIFPEPEQQGPALARLHLQHPFQSAAPVHPSATQSV